MTYISETIELEDVPNVRAHIVLDEYPHAPEFDNGYPVIRLEYRGYCVRTEGHAYGQEVAGMEDALDKFLTETDDGLETFARYLRIFHGGDAVVIERPTSREYGYVVYGTRSLLDSWDCTEETEVQPEAKEWEAYIAGDVHGIVVERKVTTTTIVHDYATGDEIREESDVTWEEIESVWGFYEEDVWSERSYTRAEATVMVRAYGKSEVAA